MHRRLLTFLALIVLAGALLFAPPAHAAPEFQTDTPEPTATSTATATPTPTNTPAATATPPYLMVYTLTDGGQLWVERRWTWGEAGVVVALGAFIVLYMLRWSRAVARGRE